MRTALLAAGRRVPLFDPEDGGAAARLLLLLETPGPDRNGAGDGPRFVSQDNRTPTGRNLRGFLREAGIERRDLLIWNVVPWVVHAAGARNRAVTVVERRAGMALLPALLDLLPRLRVVVLAGRHAAGAEAVVRAARSEVAVLTMPHPSPVICCTDPVYPARIAATLREAAAVSRGEQGALPSHSAAAAAGKGRTRYVASVDQFRQIERPQ